MHYKMLQIWMYVYKLYSSFGSRRNVETDLDFESPDGALLII